MGGVSFDALWQVGLAVIAAGSVYGGIRSDIRAMHERMMRAEKQIDRAHERINECGLCQARYRKTDGPQN